MGARRGLRDARNLFGEALRVVNETRPRWFVGENVVGFKSLGLAPLLDGLERIGYKGGQSFCIPASSANAPHTRYRLFIVAFNGEYEEGRYRYISEGENPEDLSSDPISTGWCSAVPSEVWGAEESRRYYNGEELDKPSVRRVVYGAANRLSKNDRARIRACGNGVVPQQIYPIMRYIKLIDDMILTDVEQ